MSDWYSGVMKKQETVSITNLINQMPTEDREKFKRVLEDPAKKQITQDCLDQAGLGNYKMWVESAISGKIEGSTYDSNGYTILHLVTWRNDTESVIRLLDEGSFPVDSQSKTGQTPLGLAIVAGNYSLIKLFLDRGADIEARDSYEMTPLLIAVQTHQMGPFFVLVHRGADVHAVDLSGCDVAHWAAYRNYPDFLRILKNYISLEAPDNTGMTPLHKAASSNALAAIEYLLFEGVNADTRDKNAKTAAEVSKEYRTEGAAETILKFSKDRGVLERYFTVWFLVFWACLCYGYTSRLLEYTSHQLALSALFNVSGLLVLPLFLLIKFSDPGGIPRQHEGLESAVVKSFGEYFEKEEFSSIPSAEGVCFTCFIPRAQRSKHCRLCDSCTLKHDHHCVFLGKCIAQKNHLRFVVGLAVHYVGVLSYLLLVWTMLETRLSEEDFVFTSTYTVKILIEFVGLDTVNFIMSLLCVPMLWYCWWYLFLELYSISQNLTANEVLNRHRYRYLYAPYHSIDRTVKLQFKNPFTQGLLKNWIEFFIS